MNSREKGKRGERQWRDELRANGYAARRGQQYAGGADSPDVVCDELSWAHMEVKFTERFNLYDALDQAIHDAGVKRVPFVMHKRNFRRWVVVMEGETFFRLVRGELPPGGRTRDGARPDGGVTESVPVEAASCPETATERDFGNVPGESPDTAGGSVAVPPANERPNNKQPEQTEQQHEDQKQ